jgi:hypothetical protein
MKIAMAVRFLLTLVALLLASPLAAQSADPAAIVKSIYPDGSQSEAAVSLQMRAPHRHALSKALAALWQKSDDATPSEDEPVPGFDIASNSQDREIARADVKVERRDGRRATVSATLFNKGPRIPYPKSDDIVRYDFVREGGAWKIDDVRSAIHGKPWSLRALLGAGLKHIEPKP